MAAFIAVGSVVLTAMPAGARVDGRSAGRYRLVDFGTFGGPNAFYDGFQPALMMNSRGVVTGLADTKIADPHPSSCFNPDDCYLVHAFSGTRTGNVTDLGALPGVNSSHSDAINDSGMIVGQSQNGKIDPSLHQPTAVATYWIHGHLRRLPGLRGTQSFAMGVNNGGVMVGWASNTTPYTTSPWGNLGTEQRAVLWRAGKRIKDLGTLGGPAAVAYLVNSHGAVTGQSLTNDTVNQATGMPTADPFLWRNNRMQDLGTLGGVNGSPVALNDRGEVAGQSDLKGDAAYHPFLWSAGKMIDLGTLGGTNGFPYAMNNAGHVVGSADLSANNVHHGFLWRDRKMIDLGVAKGKTCSTAFDVNSKDQVVGESHTCGSDPKQIAILWQKGHIVDLNTLVSPAAPGWRLAEGLAINNRGDIAAYGIPPNGHVHIVLLVPRK